MSLFFCNRPTLFIAPAPPVVSSVHVVSLVVFFPIVPWLGSIRVRHRPPTGLEAAAALRGVALQRGRVRATYPAAAAAAAAAALARPQLTAATLG